jgi:hypothetical protein
LAYILFEKTKRDNIKAAFEPVSFIVFNYDRCLEWFLFCALIGLYFLTDEAAQNALSHLGTSKYSRDERRVGGWPLRA